jgi:hypothetical protein
VIPPLAMFALLALLLVGTHAAVSIILARLRELLQAWHAWRAVRLDRSIPGSSREALGIYHARRAWTLSSARRGQTAVSSHKCERKDTSWTQGPVTRSEGNSARKMN